MVLFKKVQAKPDVTACKMCGKTRDDGCGNQDNHIEHISATEPEWLPENYRTQAIGEYSWVCTRCNAYPELKWPKTGGASSGIMIHLGEVHGIGLMAGKYGTPATFGMRPLSYIPAPPLRRVGYNDRVQLKEWLDRYGTVGAGTHAEVEPVIIALARIGGSGPAHELAARAAAGRIAAEWIPSLVSRPWKWMLRTAQEASRQGDRVLSVRAAMFICHWAEYFGPNLGPADIDALGLGDVPPAVHVDAVVLGLSDAQRLPADTPVAWDTTSRVLAGDAVPAMATRLALLHYAGKQVPSEALATARAISARSTGG
jgi:hypothetical protein